MGSGIYIHRLSIPRGWLTQTGFGRKENSNSRECGLDPASSAPKWVGSVLEPTLIRYALKSGRLAPYCKTRGWKSV